MRGTKRFASSSDSDPSANDSALRNKRVLPSSPIDAQRAEPSQQKLTAPLSLDARRAESASQHVRALNNQFVSWVQTQLKNHPDELWEDGVKDYLAHASNILEKFSDVVNWLKANAAKGENSFPSESNNNKSKSVPNVQNNEVKLDREKAAYAPANAMTGSISPWSSSLFSKSQSGSLTDNNDGGLTNNQSGIFSSNQSGAFRNSEAFSKTPSLFSNSQSGAISSSQPSVLFSSSQPSALFSSNQPSSLFSSSQPPVLFGIQGSTFTSQRAPDDADDDEPPQPSSPSVKKTEEKGVVVVHEVKCKLYVKSCDPGDKDAWKDKGTGQLSIKCKEGIDKGTKESKPTILIRNDVGKLLLNALLYPGIKTNKQKKSIVAIFHTSDDTEKDNVVARTFLIRTRTEEDRNKLAAAIQEYAPAS